MGDRMYAVVSVITASACVGAFIYFLPDAKPELLPGSNLNTFVKIRDKVEEENAEIGVDELSDYSPLFLPTRWNYGRDAYSPDYKSMSEPKAIKATYAVPLENKSIVLEKDNIESAKTGLYRSIMRSVFSGLGRKDSKTDIVAERSALIKVVDMSSGKKAIGLRSRRYNVLCARRKPGFFGNPNENTGIGGSVGNNPNWNEDEEQIMDKNN